MGLALAVVLSAVPYDFRTHALHFPERVQEVSMIQPASQGVVMFVMDDLLNDPRVQREARSAVRAGFQVTVIALQSDRCRIERETVDGYEVVRVRIPRFMIMSLFFRIWGLVLLVELILKEGLKLALGLPPGPEAPGQAPGVPSRLRRVKWGL